MGILTYKMITHGQKIEIRIDNSLKRTSKTDGQTNRQTGKQTKVLYC